MNQQAWMSNASPGGRLQRPGIRRILMVGGAVLVLLASMFASTATTSAEPLPPLSVAITATPSQAEVGTPVTIKGKVTGFHGNIGPTGYVLFFLDDRKSVSAEVAEDGSFETVYTDLKVGSRELSAEYRNDETYGDAESPLITVTIVEVAPTTTTTTTAPAPTPGAPGGSYGDASTAMTAKAGEKLSVRGENWHAGTDVTVTLRSEPVVLGTAAVGTDGTFAQSYTIPAGTTAGAHTVTLSGTGVDGQPASVVLDLTVVAATQPIAAPAVAATPSFTG